MKSRRDLVQAWVRKAESDLANARLCLEHGTALDTACFHAQQAAEKMLKAYLTCTATEFPFVHNLEQLVTLCSQHDAAFDTLLADAAALTPFAVALRYDADFWPDSDAVRRAIATAGRIAALCRDRIALATP